MEPHTDRLQWRQAGQREGWSHSLLSCRHVEPFDDLLPPVHAALTLGSFSHKMLTILQPVGRWSRSLTLTFMSGMAQDGPWIEGRVRGSHGHQELSFRKAAMFFLGKKSCLTADWWHRREPLPRMPWFLDLTEKLMDDADLREIFRGLWPGSTW